MAPCKWYDMRDGRERAWTCVFFCLYNSAHKTHTIRLFAHSQATYGFSFSRQANDADLCECNNSNRRRKYMETRLQIHMQTNGNRWWWILVSIDILYGYVRMPCNACECCTFMILCLFSSLFYVTNPSHCQRSFIVPATVWQDLRFALRIELNTFHQCTRWILSNNT